jgi:hypothetical protein
MIEVNRAVLYRKLARDCLEVAERMSIDAERDRLVDMASRWTEMASRAEHEDAGEKSQR